MALPRPACAGAGLIACLGPDPEFLLSQASSRRTYNAVRLPPGTQRTEAQVYNATIKLQLRSGKRLCKGAAPASMRRTHASGADCRLWRALPLSLLVVTSRGFSYLFLALSAQAWISPRCRSRRGLPAHQLQRIGLSCPRLSARGCRAGRAFPGRPACCFKSSSRVSSALDRTGSASANSTVLAVSQSSRGALAEAFRSPCAIWIG